MPARRMLSNLFSSFRSSRNRRDNEHEHDHAPSPGPANRDYVHLRHATADFTEAEDEDEDESNDDDDEEEEQQYGRGRGGDEDGRRHSGAVLPLFSATHLDSLPVYSITHAIRIIVQTRTETNLSWEQLRSPQVSQFLVKPMQQTIRTQHFSRATIYALMANCLQFAKEGQMYPGNAQTSFTRSKVCELLAIKLLKEFNTRELIDALSYDFYPMQGVPGTQTPMTPRDNRPRPAAARTSTLEVAIRASAKHFLAHPLVVQQLEAIWNGAISFYSSADNIHRRNTQTFQGVQSPGRSNERTPLIGFQQGKENQNNGSIYPPVRRTVTLYDPRNASLFKLSRLRVPRYRQFLSTCSLAILICLFLAVLLQRSDRITSLELIFWFWSAGFMLDELVGFNEQGFSLYIMSFWNIFDLGILLLLIIYYCMRIYGVFLVDPKKWNDNAYDVLAANAILLLPRIFSVLDHYPYFSQLLIAFRLMAVDLAAVFVLISVSCSGFFVFFTFSRNENDAGEVAYKIFQLLMGFTPAAWEMWPTYSWLERGLMALFLIICHFVVVTILITVLTNSFMSIASNATEEHQFLFAINTISMVKNDSLFSYVAPGNIFAWILMPLRYCMSLRQFVWLNRMVIKFTHLPLLFSIFIYEKYLLAPSMYEPTDLVEQPGRGRQRAISIDPTSRAQLFSPTIRIREESTAGFKDRALEEVFRRTPDYGTLRTQKRNDRRKTQSAIRNWMDQHDAIPESPNVVNNNHTNYSTINSRPQQDFHQRKHSLGRERPPRRFHSRHLSETRSIASDPADLMSTIGFTMGGDSYFDTVDRRDHAEQNEVKDQTDADGDDELVTNDEDEDDNDATNTAASRHSNHAKSDAEGDDYFTTPVASRFNNQLISTSLGSSVMPPQQQYNGPPIAKRGGLHSRTMSSNTILFNPPPTRPPRRQQLDLDDNTSPRSRPISTRPTPAGSPRRTAATRARPTVTTREPAPNRATPGITINAPPRPRKTRRLSSSDLLDAQSDLAGMADDAFGGVPSSFVTQMAMATGMITPGGMGKKNGDGQRDSDRMSRLVLARMKTLEEGFADVVREIRSLQRSSGLPSTARNSASSEGSWKGSEGFTTGVEARSPRRPKATTNSSKASGSTERPLSRRGAGDTTRSPLSKTVPADIKGKGREVPQSDADDDDDDTDDGGPSFTRMRGSL